MLQDKFGDRVISRLTTYIWPAKSPDLSPLDFYFLAVAMQELRRVPPPTLKDLVETVKDFGKSLDPADLRATVRDVKKSAWVCKRFFGGPSNTSSKKLRDVLGFKYIKCHSL